MKSILNQKWNLFWIWLHQHSPLGFRFNRRIFFSTFRLRASLSLPLAVLGFWVGAVLQWQRGSKFCSGSRGGLNTLTGGSIYAWASRVWRRTSFSRYRGRPRPWPRPWYRPWWWSWQWPWHRAWGWAAQRRTSGASISWINWYSRIVHICESRIVHAWIIYTWIVQPRIEQLRKLVWIISRRRSTVFRTFWERQFSSVDIFLFAVAIYNPKKILLMK